MKRFVVIVFLCIPLLLHAEHVFEFGLHGGLTGLDAQTVYVNSRVGWNGGGQIYYTYFSPRIIGLRTGLNIDGHQAGIGKNDYEDTYSTIDVDNQQMDIAYRIGKLSERYTTWSLSVPLQLAFSRNRFSLFAGAKAEFPLYGSWKQSAEKAVLSVYYPTYDNRVEESYPLAASRDFEMQNSGRWTPQKVRWWLALDFSYAFPLNTWARNYKSYLIVGAYFDYCFTRFTPTTSNRESLIMLTDTRDGFPLQRILTPAMEANRQERKLVKDFTPFDVGIKISYAISPYDPHSQAHRGCHCL